MVENQSRSLLSILVVDAKNATASDVGSISTPQPQPQLSSSFLSSTVIIQLRSVSGHGSIAYKGNKTSGHGVYDQSPKWTG
jgi:hypothetical protein